MAETLARDLGVPFDGSLGRLAPEELPPVQKGAVQDSDNSQPESLGPGPGLRFLTHPWLGHSVNDLEMQELGVWIGRCLPPAL